MGFHCRFQPPLSFAIVNCNRRVAQLTMFGPQIYKPLGDFHYSDPMARLLQCVNATLYCTITCSLPYYKLHIFKAFNLVCVPIHTGHDI